MKLRDFRKYKPLKLFLAKFQKNPPQDIGSIELWIHFKFYGSERIIIIIPTLNLNIFMLVSLKILPLTILVYWVYSIKSLKSSFPFQQSIQQHYNYKRLQTTNRWGHSRRHEYVGNLKSGESLRVVAGSYHPASWGQKGVSARCMLTGVYLKRWVNMWQQGGVPAVQVVTIRRATAEARRGSRQNLQLSPVRRQRPECTANGEHFPFSISLTLICMS